MKRTISIWISVAAHWRRLPPSEVDELRPQINDHWTRIAENSQLEVHAFDGGLELRPKGRDKGSAVNEVLTSISTTFAAAYLGDDLTDEDAFRALAGSGHRVLVRDNLRDTLADAWAKPPEDLIEFLIQWKSACADAG